MNSSLCDSLTQKTLWVKRELLLIHKIAPETRLASSLSDIEIFVALYYGGILKFDSKNIHWENRDRFVISKGHGAISLYPILADLGFFDKAELSKVCTEDSMLGGIPDNIPGFETINGSLGQGLGVACGMALALKRKKLLDVKMFVLLGDGELYEGSVWEAIMFAGHHRLGNIVLIVDSNKIAMLDYCKNIIDLEPLGNKFNAFKWKVNNVNGHNVEELYTALNKYKNDTSDQPKVLIADTIKGNGVPELEKDPLCHIKSLKSEEVDKLLGELK